jgi:hypothetical protein
MVMVDDGDSETACMVGDGDGEAVGMVIHVVLMYHDDAW